MTPNEKNLECRMYLPELRIDLYFYYKLGRVYYEFFFEGKRLFSGDDYSPSGCYDPFSIPSMVALLDWMTLAPGDTDREYFEKYTPEQLAWCKTIQREDLTIDLYDYEGGTEKQQARAETYFNKSYTRYIHEDFFSLNDLAKSAPDGKIYLTQSQRKNLWDILAKGKPSKILQKRIEAAMDDGFKKIKKRRYLESILFNEDQVTFIPQKRGTLIPVRSQDRKLKTIIKHLTKYYRSAA